MVRVYRDARTSPLTSTNSHLEPSHRRVPCRASGRTLATRSPVAAATDRSARPRRAKPRATAARAAPAKASSLVVGWLLGGGQLPGPTPLPDRGRSPVMSPRGRTRVGGVMRDLRDRPVTGSRAGASGGYGASSRGGVVRREALLRVRVCPASAAVVAAGGPRAHRTVRSAPGSRSTESSSGSSSREPASRRTGVEPASGLVVGDLGPARPPGHVQRARPDAPDGVERHHRSAHVADQADPDKGCDDKQAHQQCVGNAFATMPPAQLGGVSSPTHST